MIARTAMDVSIVICTRDRGASLGGTLASLAAIRSAHPWEAIVLDNGSVDETRAVIERADDCGGRLRYAFEASPGLGAARDAAWRLARGDLVAFTDDDCYLAPDFVDAIVASFAERADAGCIGGRILLHDPDDARVTIDERAVAVRIAPFTFPRTGALQGANLSFRRSVLEAIGGIDPALGAGTPFPCEDIDAVAATLAAGHAAWFDPRPSVRHHHRRKHADLAATAAGYDLGRGAYFAKYLLRRGTRRAVLALWWSRARSEPSVTRAGLEREIAAARRYVFHRRAAHAWLMLLPFVTMLRAIVARRDRKARRVGGVASVAARP